MYKRRGGEEAEISWRIPCLKSKVKTYTIHKQYLNSLKFFALHSLQSICTFKYNMTAGRGQRKRESAGQRGGEKRENSSLQPSIHFIQRRFFHSPIFTLPYIMKYYICSHIQNNQYFYWQECIKLIEYALSYVWERIFQPDGVEKYTGRRSFLYLQWIFMQIPFIHL